MVTENSVNANANIVRGGQNYYGIKVGILLLETSFPRIPGDVGNAETWQFPVTFKVVRGATPEIVVTNLQQSDLLPAFNEAARDFEAAGIPVITTSCGFLALYQKEMQEALSSLILTSSLLQVPWVAGLVAPGTKVGILSVDSRSLTPAHLRGAGIGPEIPIAVEGLEDMGGLFDLSAEELDPEQARDRLAAAVKRLLTREPDIAALVLESAIMPPYAADIRRRFGLPVYDLTTLVNWAVAGLGLRGFNRIASG
jgi:hypothetical protein